MAVIPEGENAAYNRDKEEQDHNSLPVFYYEMGERRWLVRHIPRSFFPQEFKKFIKKK
jgi:hypothetical protein